jgi:hypothetical protein
MTKNTLAAGIESSFAVLSIRGKVWRLKHQKNEEVLYRKGTTDPVSKLNVIIVRANENLSKVYYEGGYTPGDDKPPVCWSNDGLRPDRRVPPQQRQSATCATCPKGAWGSKISENGKKTKACADSKRLAVVPYADPTNEAYGGPMLLRVPAASLQAIAKLGNELASAGYAEHEVAVTIGFDTSAEHPKLTFEPYKVLSPERAAIVSELRNSPQVAAVLGSDETAVVDSEDDEESPPAALRAALPAPPLSPTPKPAKAPKAAPPEDDEEDDEEDEEDDEDEDDEDEDDDDEDEDEDEEEAAAAPPPPPPPPAPVKRVKGVKVTKAAPPPPADEDEDGGDDDDVEGSVDAMIASALSGRRK